MKYLYLSIAFILVIIFLIISAHRLGIKSGKNECQKAQLQKNLDIRTSRDNKLIELNKKLKKLAKELNHERSKDCKDLLSTNIPNNCLLLYRSSNN